MKHVFIINPAAGKRSCEQKIRSEVARIFQKGEDVAVFVTTRPGEAAEIAEREGKNGEVRFYACGGDGTLNETASGMAKYPNCSLACVPMGTGNDYIKAFSPLTEEDFRSVERLVNGRELQVDTMETNGHFTLNISSIGFDAAVNYQTRLFKKKRGVSASGAYGLAIAYCLFHKIGHRFQITVDGAERPEGEYLMCTACCGQYYGGGFHPAPDGKIDDGMLEFLLVRRVPRVRMVSLLGKYKRGEYQSAADIIEYIKGCSLSVRCMDGRKAVLHYDGEPLVVDHADFTLRKEKLRFVVPAL